MIADLGASLLRRYNTIMRGAVVAVVLVGCALAWVHVSHEIAAQEAVLLQRMQRRGAAVDAIFKNAVDAVIALRSVADLRWRTIPATTTSTSPLLNALLASRQADGRVNLDVPPAPWRAVDAGNLTGVLPADPDPTLLLELEVSLALSSTFLTVQASNPGVASVYYTSARNFIAIYPWYFSQEFRYSPVLQEREFFTRGLLYANPAREPFWTDVYLDDAGQGLMVTVAAPVDALGEFRGTLSIDLTLNELRRHLAGVYGKERGRLLLITPQGKVVAHSDLAVGLVDVPTNLADVLPPSLVAALPALLAEAGPDHFTAVAGHHVAVMHLQHAPYIVLQVVGGTERLANGLRSGLLMVSLLAGGLMVMLLMTGALVRQQFVTPSRQLLRFIQDESQGPAERMPDVLPAWRPWFDTIRRVFGAHARLAAIEQELDVARRIQQSILPTRFPLRADLELFGCMVPAKDVAGDFYDYFWLDEWRLGLVIADVSGKGVAAAMFMAVARTLLRATAAGDDGPARCLAAVNALLVSENDACMFVTTFYAVLDIRDGVLRFANGGHNAPLILTPDGAVIPLVPPDGLALGVVEDFDVGEACMTLAPGSALILYTDGVTEAFDPEQRAFGEERLSAALVGAAGLGAQGMATHLLEAVRDFAGSAPQSDDIAILALRFHGTEGG